MERTIPQPGDPQPEVPPKAQTNEAVQPMPLADQPTADSDAPPQEAVTMPDGKSAQMVAAQLTRQEQAALVQRQNAMTDLTKMTQNQLEMMGLRGQTPQDVLLFTLYAQVRHLQSMFDALCDVLLAAPMLVSVPSPDPALAAKGEDQQIGVGPLSRETYFKVCSLKAEAQVSMIRRQMLSAGGVTLPKPGRKDS